MQLTFNQQIAILEKQRDGFDCEPNKVKEILLDIGIIGLVSIGPFVIDNKHNL